VSDFAVCLGLKQFIRHLSTNGWWDQSLGDEILRLKEHTYLQRHLGIVKCHICVSNNLPFVLSKQNISSSPILILYNNLTVLEQSFIVTIKLKNKVYETKKI